MDEDTEAGGYPVAARQVVSTLLRAANRDPAGLDDSDRSFSETKRAPHVRFGGGSHISIGAPLTRLEGKVALLKLIQRVPELKIVDPDALPNRRSRFFCGLAELIVAI